VIRTVVLERLSMVRHWLPKDACLYAKVVLLALASIQLARLLWLLAVPAGPFGDWHPAQARFPSPQAQAAVLASVDPFFRNASIGTESLPDLDLRLFGTREDRGGAGGSAIIGPPDGEQKSHMVGEEVEPGVKLAAVFFDHVVLDRGAGRQQILSLEPFGGGAAPPSGDAADPAEDGLSPAAVHETVQFAPRMREGRVTGVVVSSRGDPARFAALGFRPGDVIVAVNGARITSQTDLVQLQSSMVAGARLSLMVERGAETVPIALNFAGS